MDSSGRMRKARILVGDVLERLRELPSNSIHCCVTSPPYFGLRNYGTEKWEGGDGTCDHSTPRSRGEDIRLGDKQGTSAGSRPNTQKICKCGAVRIDQQIGLEETPELYAQKLIDVFREVRRVLRSDGVLWLNLGDSFYNHRWGEDAFVKQTMHSTRRDLPFVSPKRGIKQEGLKEKDLIGIPWMTAFALRAGFAACSICRLELRSDLWPIWNGHKICIDCLRVGKLESKVIQTERGWWLRRDIIWAKAVSFCDTYSGSAMPESVMDRPSTSHEYMFLLTKSEEYYYDKEAVKEPSQTSSIERMKHGWNGNQKRGYVDGEQNHLASYVGTEKAIQAAEAGRNLRSVWTINPQPFKGEHFAAYPIKLVEPCIKLSTSERGCCPKCGAPQERIVESISKVDVPRGSVPSSLRANMQGPQQAGVSCTTSTLGWQPTCNHFRIVEIVDQKLEPANCVVLDPFCGSGTTGVVALSLGCDFIGIELNPVYAEMARKRIYDSAPLFNEVTVE